jgi:hypothetical protein
VLTVEWLAMEKKACLDEAPIQSVEHKHLILWGMKYRLAQSGSHYFLGLILSDMEDNIRNALQDSMSPELSCKNLQNLYATGTYFHLF